MPIQHSEIAISRPLRPTVSTKMPPGTLAMAPAAYWQVRIDPISL